MWTKVRFKEYLQNNYLMSAERGSEHTAAICIGSFYNYYVNGDIPGDFLEAFIESYVGLEYLNDAQARQISAALRQLDFLGSPRQCTDLVQQCLWWGFYTNRHKMGLISKRDYNAMAHSCGFFHHAAMHYVLPEVRY